MSSPASSHARSGRLAGISDAPWSASASRRQSERRTDIGRARLVRSGRVVEIAGAFRIDEGAVFIRVRTAEHRTTNAGRRTPGAILAAVDERLSRWIPARRLK